MRNPGLSEKDTAKMLDYAKQRRNCPLRVPCALSPLRAVLTLASLTRNALGTTLWRSLTDWNRLYG